MTAKGDVSLTGNGSARARNIRDMHSFTRNGIQARLQSNLISEAFGLMLELRPKRLARPLENLMQEAEI